MFLNRLLQDNQNILISTSQKHFIEGKDSIDYAIEADLNECEATEQKIVEKVSSNPARSNIITRRAITTATPIRRK